MIKTQDLFSRPKLRLGVEVAQQGTSVSLEYRDQSCDFELESGHDHAMLDFLQELKDGGVSISALKERQYRGVSLDVIKIIEELDRLGLITESDFPVKDVVTSGGQLYRELVRLGQRVKLSSSSTFYNLLRTGQATKRQIIGYAIEYYHVVRLAPGLIGPSLAFANPRKTQNLLQEFLMSELFHDKMLESSLRAVGIDVRGLEYLQPLPGTFSICSSLGVFAKQHALSFYGALFLFEEPYPEFNDALVHACESVGIPQGFYEPIIRHSDVNEDFGHDNISRQLLEGVAAISAEEVTVTKKNIAILVEMFLRQEREIISYYGDEARPQLRIFN